MIRMKTHNVICKLKGGCDIEFAVNCLFQQDGAKIFSILISKVLDQHRSANTCRSDADEAWVIRLK